MNKQTAIDNYKQAEQDYKDVTKGGKDSYTCSFMDISIRSDRLDKAKQELIQILGEEQFEILINTNNKATLWTK